MSSTVSRAHWTGLNVFLDWMIVVQPEALAQHCCFNSIAPKRMLPGVRHAS